MHIHQKNFRRASKKIKKNQKRYKKNYDKRKNAKPFALKIGSKVQYRRSEGKSVLSKRKIYHWVPSKAYYLISKIDREKQRVELITPQGKRLSKKQNFNNIRQAYC